MPQSVTTETGKENGIVRIVCQHFIVTVSDNASDCLVQRPLMLAFTKTVDEDEVRVTVHRYRAMNPGFRQVESVCAQKVGREAIL